MMLVVVIVMVFWYVLLAWVMSGVSDDVRGGDCDGVVIRYFQL